LKKTTVLDRLKKKVFCIRGAAILLSAFNKGAEGARFYFLKERQKIGKYASPEESAQCPKADAVIRSASAIIGGR